MITNTALQPTIPTISDYKQRMETAWQEVEKLDRQPHQVRNCPSDTQARDMAMRRWQGARSQYLEACKMEGVNP